jgi:hypothetical protein
MTPRLRLVLQLLGVAALVASSLPNQLCSLRFRATDCTG